MTREMGFFALVVVALVLLSRNAAGGSVDSFNRWDALIKDASRKHRVPWKWIKAVMIVESDLGRARSVARGLAVPSDIEGSASSDGKSWGLMQVTLGTAREMRAGTTVVDLNTPSISVDLGAQYLARMMKRFPGDRDSVIRAYNGGPGFASTARGPLMTLAYLAKFTNALARVQAASPGPEDEIA